MTQRARREQIVDAAVATIAERGLAGASFARIAERAGLSSVGLISYHFDGRADLLAQIVEDYVRDISAWTGQRMSAARSPAQALETYVRANVAFIADHPERMRALTAIFLGGGFQYDAKDEAAAVSPLEQILRDGQEAGEFRDFDVVVMAALVQRAVDGLPFLLQSGPDLDPAGYADEVVMVFRLATTSD
ncbi:TetR family transcriptional regulator [Intrasporangium mesophilum]